MKSIHPVRSLLAAKSYQQSHWKDIVQKNVLKSLTIVTSNSILNFTAVLAPSLAGVLDHPVLNGKFIKAQDRALSTLMIIIFSVFSFLLFPLSACLFLKALKKQLRMRLFSFSDFLKVYLVLLYISWNTIK